MPYVKSIPIRSTVNRSIAYILNPSKTDDLLHASGINVVADKSLSYQQFKNVYIKFDAMKNSHSNTKKKPILAHHFVQSFKKDDVTAEQAQLIGHEWAKKVFGDNHQVVIATHNDKGHIHNHFIVNAYGFDGKKFYSNKTSLNRLRSLSDDISLEYGIQPIEGNTRKGVHYKEWMERNKGTSWKQNIRLAIDKALIVSNSIDELIDHLKSQKYEVKRGKYISIKPHYLERFVRIHNLGEEYSEEKLIERLKNKGRDIPVEIAIPSKQPVQKTKPQQKKQTNKYKGIQLKYVSLIRLVADLIVSEKKPVRKYNRKKPYSVENDFDVQKLAAHLRLLNREGIESETQLYAAFGDIDQAFKDTKNTLDNLSGLAERLKGLIDHSRVYFSLRDKENISSRDKLKLSIAKSSLEKYNISKIEDIEKMSNELDRVNRDRDQLLKSFDDLQTKYRSFKDLTDTYSKISNGSYLTNIQHDRAKGREENER